MEPFFPFDIYLFKVNNGNTSTMCEICSKLTKKTPERRQWRRTGIFIVNCEQISHIILVNSVADFEYVNAWRVICTIQRVLQKNISNLKYYKKYEINSNKMFSCKNISLSSFRCIYWLNILENYLIII